MLNLLKYKNKRNKFYKIRINSQIRGLNLKILRKIFNQKIKVKIILFRNIFKSLSCFYDE